MTANDHTSPQEAHAMRYVESLALGSFADELFEYECRRLGLVPRLCLAAPLDWLSVTARGSDARN